MSYYDRYTEPPKYEHPECESCDHTECGCCVANGTAKPEKNYYVAIISDDILSYFRLDIDGTKMVMVVTDFCGCSRGIEIMPLNRPYIAFEHGKGAYITQGHIQALLDYERQEQVNEVLNNFKKEFGGADNETGKNS